MARSEDDPKDKPLYMISVAAELTGMHPQTLRVYEQKGLVTPGRSRGNTRLYSQGDIERLNLVSKLTDEGINLAGVVRILDMRERQLEKDREIDKLHHGPGALRRRRPRAGHARASRVRPRGRREVATPHTQAAEKSVAPSPRSSLI